MLKFDSFYNLQETRRRHLRLEETKPNNKQPFGYLAGYDIYNATGPLMDNTETSKKAIEKFLIKLVEELKMKIASKPVCYMSTEKEIKTMQHIGASAFIALENSGIMLHTITNKNPKFCCLDVFSCKIFRPRMIEDFLKKEFQTDNIIFKFSKRGTKYNTK